LIKREIQARNFFLLCDSGNAKSSKWVQGTIAHVKSLQTKQVETIDLDADWQAQIDGIQAIVRHATVFLSFAQTNDAAIAPVRTGLIENDFCVWDLFHNLPVGDSVTEQNPLPSRSPHGWFLYSFLESRFPSNLMTHDAIGADARIELGISEASPWASDSSRPGIDVQLRHWGSHGPPGRHNSLASQGLNRLWPVLR
jgi:hypothetical protein